MSTLTGYDLTKIPMGANVCHYGPGDSLNAHEDQPEKLVTQERYFDRSWNRADCGFVTILRSAEVAGEISPIVGYLVNPSVPSRRGMTVTFYRPGSVSTLWPPGDKPPLHHYHAAVLR
jgi:hypothetical protein